MKPKLDTRIYTNFILTVIATLLLLLTLNTYKVSMGNSAYAQDQDMDGPQAIQGNRFSRPGRSAPVDVSNVPQVQDTAVAAATSEIAAANRDIAAAIRELSRGVETASTAYQNAPRPAAANVTMGAEATNTQRPQPPADATRPIIEVGPTVPQ